MRPLLILPALLIVTACGEEAETLSIDGIPAWLTVQVDSTAMAIGETRQVTGTCSWHFHNRFDFRLSPADTDVVSIDYDGRLTAHEAGGVWIVLELDEHHADSALVTVR